MDIKGVGNNLEMKQDFLSNILLFGSDTFYSVLKGVIQPQFQNLNILDPEKFIYFDCINLEISKIFQTQIQFFENILDILNQMYICFCNYSQNSNKENKSKYLQYH
jgi:hypothetical protein